MNNKYFTEAVWRLPGCYLCYAPHDLDVKVALPPALNDGNITFGCFNNRAKITANTVRVWANILRRLDGSRLFLKTKSLNDPAVGETLVAQFASPWDCFGSTDLGGTLAIRPRRWPPTTELTSPSTRSHLVAAPRQPRLSGWACPW